MLKETIKDVRDAATILRAEGCGSTLRVSLTRLLARGRTIDVNETDESKRVSGACFLGALIDDASKPEPLRATALELLQLVRKLYGYNNPHKPPEEFNAIYHAERLDKLAVELAGEPIDSDDGKPGMWSKLEPPSEWATILGCTERQFVKACAEGTIRHQKWSSKLYRLHVSELVCTRRQ